MKCHLWHTMWEKELKISTFQLEHTPTTTTWQVGINIPLKPMLTTLETVTLEIHTPLMHLHPQTTALPLIWPAQLLAPSMRTPHLMWHPMGIFLLTVEMLRLSLKITKPSKLMLKNDAIYFKSIWLLFFYLDWGKTMLVRVIYKKPQNLTWKE